MNKCRVPLNEPRRGIWLQTLGLNSCSSIKTYSISMRHFERGDFQGTDDANVLRLKLTAVPSLFLPV